MHRERFARLEEEALRTSGKLDEVDYAARPAADLDDVTTLHVGRCDLNVGGERAAGRPSLHWFTCCG
ncbi:hypothetical protein AB0C97_12175 [Streptomyces goshikiensis]|uniref:hypothetical protein n=1 Tax=Streptomyces goshikiensis TaxID=1942 RepID=UPI0033C1B548